MGTAIVFPGMGPADPALGRYLAVDPIARRLRRIADEVLGYPLLDRYRATGDEYAETAVVAFLVGCLALAEWAGRRLDVRPELCVGASFGQKAAAGFTGALSPADTIRLAVRLTRCEVEYFGRAHTDVVTQSFARTPGEALAGILAELDARGQWYAYSGEVDEDLHMVSLREATVPEFTRRVRAAGGLPLREMRPPVHCAGFAPLRELAAGAVADLAFAAPDPPIVSDQDGSLVTTGAGVRELVLDYFVRPVRWPATIAALAGRGVTRVCVCGPDALFGRVGCTTRAFDVLPVAPRLALRPRDAIDRPPAGRPPGTQGHGTPGYGTPGHGTQRLGEAHAIRVG